MARLIQTVQRWARELRAWIGERFGHGQREEQAIPLPVEKQTQHKAINPEFAQRQKDLLQRMRNQSLRQDHGQSRGLGHGHGR